MTTTKIKFLLLFTFMILTGVNKLGAYDFESDGLYYDILSEEDRTIAVTYETWNYGTQRNPYSGKGEIEIPPKVVYHSKTYTVTSIENDAFRDCRNIKSVMIPNSVTTIGESAFRKCWSLTSVTIGNSVRSIGDRAFYDCGLESMIIPNSVTSIGGGAFSNCTSLTSVTIGNSTTSIGISVFCGCSKLKTIYIEPDNVKYSSIDGVLYNKDASTLICCPGGKTTVTIPNSVTSIGSEAFWGCTGLTSVMIPNSVTSIGSHAFSGCSSLISLMIPNSVTSIGNRAFGGCSSFISVTIPNSVTSIGDWAFSQCTGLTSVTIPNSVTSIGDGAFSDCSKLEAIYVQSQDPIECSPRFPDNVIKDAILYVPTGTMTAYEKVDPWRNFWNIEEMDFGGVEETAADGRDPQISVVNGIIRIGNAEGNPLVEVFDISGKNVFRGNDTTVSGLANGIYIVKVGANVVRVRL